MILNGPQWAIREQQGQPQSNPRRGAQGLKGWREGVKKKAALCSEVLGFGNCVSLGIWVQMMVQNVSWRR